MMVAHRFSLRPKDQAYGTLILQNRLSLVVFPVRPRIAFHGGATPLVDRPLAWWIGLFIMFAGLLVPILLVEVPPLTDYPNHLARSYVLAYGQERPILNQMVVADWKIVPNLAIDLILPPLLQIFPVLIAGRIVLALCLLIPTSGAVALSYAYFRRRSFFQMGAGFVAFNALFLLGLINFQISIGVALWGAAGWIFFSKRFPALDLCDRYTDRDCCVFSARFRVSLLRGTHRFLRAMRNIKERRKHPIGSAICGEAYRHTTADICHPPNSIFFLTNRSKPGHLVAVLGKGILSLSSIPQLLTED